MTTKKKLVKEMVLTANLADLTETNFVKKTTGMVQAEIDNPLLVPGLNPAPPIVQGKINSLTGYFTMRDTLKNQQKANTKLIGDTIAAITNDITNSWRPQAQTALTGTPNGEANAGLLGFGTKGVDTGHGGLPTARAANSYPLIREIDVNVHLQHTLHTVNSATGHNKLPADAKHIEVYEQIGGAMPTSIKGMLHAGICKHGKFINHFDAIDPSTNKTNLGLTVWYILVYVDKKTLVMLEQSPALSGIIN
ncbi:MAG TPA: hypothetical protein VF411_03490 [Bacteroidia bacterium]